ncbi:peptidase,hypothetical protein, partial [Burkholderia pseudomallei]
MPQPGSAACRVDACAPSRRGKPIGAAERLTFWLVEPRAVYG